MSPALTGNWWKQCNFSIIPIVTTSSLAYHSLPPGRGDSPNFTLAFTSTHSTIPWKVEGWVDLGTAVKVHNPCPRLYIAMVVVINTRPQWALILGSNTLQSSLITRPLRTSCRWQFLSAWQCTKSSCTQHSPTIAAWNSQISTEEMYGV